LIDVPKEISDQDFNTAKAIAFLAIADVAVIAFARLVVVSDHGASIGRPIIEPILKPCGRLGSAAAAYTIPFLEWRHPRVQHG